MPALNIGRTQAGINAAYGKRGRRIHRGRSLPSIVAKETHASGRGKRRVGAELVQSKAINPVVIDAIAAAHNGLAVSKNVPGNAHAWGKVVPVRAVGVNAKF